MAAVVSRVDVLPGFAIVWATLLPGGLGWRRAIESLPGEPPGDLGDDGTLVVGGAVVGCAVEDGVEGGLLGGDDLPQVLIDGVLGDGDVVVDRPVLPDAMQPLFHLLGFAGRPGLFGLDADSRGGKRMPDPAGADRHRDHRGLGGG